MTMVTDITHYNGVLSSRSTASEPAKKIARFMGSIVQAATAWLPDTVFGSAIHCRRKPKGKKCSGRIWLIRAVHEIDGEKTKGAHAGHELELRPSGVVESVDPSMVPR